ncbi:SDR family oxidoreductase [Porticoccaceae bacterium]|nr:SDR family oxidoreductase [Porticoccaceae bacterium]
MSKVAIITGSSGGVGRALVSTFLNDGYFVIGLDKVPSLHSTEEAYLEIEISLLDFAKDTSYRDYILSKIKEYLPSNPDKLVLINNAAEQILKSISEIQWEDWENSLAANTVAPFFLIQGLLEELVLSRGSVVNISSIHSKLSKSKFICYSVSKAALDRLTRSLALDLSPLGISVNAVAPAAISTDMLMDGFKDAPDKLNTLKDYHPSRCIGTPEDVSFFVKAVTDQRGGFLTGAVLEFNGGIGGKLSDPDA